MDKYRMLDGVQEKLCSTCKKYYPLTEDYYSSRKASKDSFSYSCKACERLTAKRSYERKKKRVNSKSHYEQNKEAYRERAKKRYAEQKDVLLDQQKSWRKTPKGKKIVNESSKRRRQRIKEQTPDGRDYTRFEIIKRDTVDGHCICGICGLPIDLQKDELQVDHIIPILQGGSDVRDNVRCTHRKCNSTRPKDGRDLDE